MERVRGCGILTFPFPLFLGVWLLGCGWLEPTAILREVHFVPEGFNPRKEETRLEYTLTEPAQVGIALYDSAGKFVVRFVDKRREEEGFHVLMWDGRDANGNSVPDGLSIATVRAGESQAKVRVRVGSR